LRWHNGLLNYFDKADNAFISAYRKHNPDGTFDIRLEYMSCPEIDNRIVIVSDPMIATGSSLVKINTVFKEEGSIKRITRCLRHRLHRRYRVRYESGAAGNDLVR